METLSLLVMNWRDPRNPEAGGAEVVTHEVSRRFVQAGHSVTLLTSRFKGCQHEESLDGVQIVRVGGKYTVYRRARAAYFDRFRGKVDIVVDEVNTVPFHTPRYVDPDSRLFAFIHQIARESWSYEVPFPFSYIGRHWLETAWLRDYFEVPTITVSPSARDALASIGFRDIRVVPEGLSVRPLAAIPPKESVPTFLFVGRLKRVKLPDHALAAFGRIRSRLPEARLWVVGDGYLRVALEKRASGDVTFFGHVSEEKKLELLRRAHVLLYPAVREGWGLSITEANAMGTPAVGYDITGLCDSIRQGETGIRVPFGDVDALAEAATGLVLDSAAYERMALNALRWASTFSWDRTAEVMLAHLTARG